MTGVRSERTVAILGDGPLARAAERACHRAGLPAACHDPFGAKGIRHRALRRVSAVVVIATYSDVEAINHLSRPQRIAALQAAVRSATGAAASGAHLVYVTSAVVCGTRQPGQWVDDDDEITPEPGAGLVEELVRIREPFAHALAQRLPAAELRLAALVGPGVDTVVTRHFEAPRILQVRGTDMRWQFIHADDAGRAVACVIARGLRGTMTAGAPGTLSIEQVCELTGMRTLTLPRASTYEAAAKLREAGMVSSPVADLSVVVEPWPVTSARLAGEGWRAQHSNADCLRAVVQHNERHGRSPGWRNPATVRAGALSAGAAIAAFSTAALVRRGRRRG